MPIIRVEMFEGRDPETKQELVKSLTTEMVRVTGCGEDSVNVIITDVKKENWGMGGDLASQKFPD
ncbi:2-hydroxymuconate tautomerase family protein [Sneathiella marina]|uniref:Tautomerase n=1 Tax=Sneathiella marina TaxID=2950108 RepID=A0ABY4W5N8_9PROT|nr:2-hydroxymuconate tautomerase family protein [Sneathiella marina]USG61030.1 2-hydroxymuconate tautomerase family protein [Sneathiella marina]